jgi:GT2 family glycosyltransferase
MEKVFIVIPNWNGKDTLPACLDSLLAHTQKARILVVENGSTDGSLDLLHSNYPSIDLVVNTRNLGFAGGVNSGIKRAIELGAKYVALFNNDAVADKNWLKELIQALDNHTEAGSATCKLLSADKKHIDSTGDFYTTWGLPYPRGRGEPASDKYDTETEVFGASGGASLYRVKMLQEIGLFDEDFFAYYEDVDLSFRAQLAGWKVIYVPKAEAYHQQGVTSGKIKGFTTYQTFKNYPMLLIKNVPFRLLPGVFIRFEIAYSAIFISSIQQGRMWPALKGFLRSQVLLPKKLWERQRIQERRKVPVSYINSLLVHDLPPNAAKLRKLRSFFVR